MIKLDFIDFGTPEIRSGAAAGSGAAFGFIIQRFFKNRDSHSERLRKLEREHARIELQIKSLIIGQRETYQQIKDLNDYIHEKSHDLANLVNQKSLKDNIVDDIDSKFDKILGMLNEKK